MNIKNKLTAIPLLGLLFLLTACPSETLCGLEAPLIVRPNKIVIAPEKRIFNSGESLRITVSIPSKIVDNENSYDIYASLGVDSSNRFTNIAEVLEGNTFTVSKGQLNNSQMVLDYDQDTDHYEFECEIRLERKGEYRQMGNQEIIAFEKNEANCEYIFVHTTIKGINQDGFYEFTVE